MTNAENIRWKQRFQNFEKALTLFIVFVVEDFLPEVEKLHSTLQAKL